MPFQIKIGEIWTQKFGFDVHEQWLRIQEGSFIAPVVDNMVPCRIIYDKREQDVVYITVDARPTLPTAFDCEDPNGFYNRVFHLVPPPTVVDCTLSIDLGNTRTVALLIDHVGDPVENFGRLPIYQLPMSWSQYPGNREQAGAFESVVSFICPDSSGDEFCGNQARLSFVKLGKYALHNNRAFGSDARNKGRYMLSSPKRYFWDKDSSRRDWIGVQYRQNNAEPQELTTKTLDCKLARGFAKDALSETSQLPPAYILSAMVAELYEQACHYVSSSTFKTMTNDDSCRRISKVHITYPSTLLPRELQEYQNQLRKGLTCYLDNYHRPVNVTLTSEIDEASAVLSVYAYSEMRKSNALFWLQSIGRMSTLGYKARIAVIDVGGGTTDLSISSVEATNAEAGIDPFKATIDLVCRNGFNNAGDAFIFDFIEHCVAELGFSSIWEASEVGEGALELDVLKARYLLNDNEGFVRGLTRGFWFDLAIKVAAECDKVLQRYPDGNVDESDFTPFEYELTVEATYIWKKLFNPRGVEGIVVKDRMIIKMNREIFMRYLESADRVFRSAARVFADSIYAYDVDLLLFSGKTSEFIAVQNVFRKYIALPESSIKSMKNFEVGSWCGHLTDNLGRIADSKISTALGGALYSLRTDSAVNMKFQDCVADLPCKWGFVTDNGPIAFQYPIFADGELQKTVPMSGYRRLIARQMPFARTAVLSYELRFKPGVLERHGGIGAESPTVTLVCDPVKQELSIGGCTGTYGDYTQVNVNDVECRLCSMNGEFMMDRIVEI